jgi:cytoskeletal protein CcmA (bactofilin family)
VLLNEKMSQMRESEITLVSEGTLLVGTLELESVARIHGTLRGKLVGRPGSFIVLASTALVEGDIEAQELWIEGFVRGQILAKGKVKLAQSARVMGDITCSSFEIEPGAYFEGSCRMGQTSPLNSTNPAAGTTAPSG